MFRATEIAAVITPKTNIRWLVVAVLFFVTMINYADRATISLAAPGISKEFDLSPVSMGYVFSAFGWAYVIAQLPGGWLLDKFGSRKVYAYSIFFWSLFTLFQGFIGFLTAGTAVVLLFCLRFLVGASEAPSFPANSRIVSSWFPTHERGTASAIFNSAQYAATAVFAPIMGWLVFTYSWHAVFVLMGLLGLGFLFIWNKYIYSPSSHPQISEGEFEYIKNGGALVDLGSVSHVSQSGPKLADIKKLLKSRMMVGIYLGQYCITVLTYFFLTWFPVYLVQARGMSILKAGIYASIPAICGFVGGLVGGFFSDWLLKRKYSLTMSRKIPIVIGMLISMSIITCNYTDSHVLIIFFMALAFFGKGVGALGWAVHADAAPKNMMGLSGGLFNVCGNSAAITTPIIIGYIIHVTGNFDGALIYVGINAFVAIMAYLLIVKDIKRLELNT